MKNKIPERVTKQILPEVEKTAEGTFRFTISDDSVDRHGDTIDPNGWDLTDFKKSPVVLWNHDPNELPIGRAVDIGVVDGKLKATVQFTSEEENPFGAQVGRMVEKGFLKATSVGFKPLDAEVAKDRDQSGFFPPYNFKKQALLEFSIVSIPANPNALLEAKGDADRMDTEAVARYCEKFLTSYKGGRWMSSAELSALGEPAKVLSLPAPAPAAPVEPTAEEVAKIVREAVDRHLAEMKMKKTGKID